MNGIIAAAAFAIKFLLDHTTFKKDANGFEFVFEYGRVHIMFMIDKKK